MSSILPLKVGLIGVGRHAREILIPAIQRLPDAIRLVALATAHEETARAAQDVYRLRCHVGHEALIANPDVEAVVIATHDHERHALAALEAGKPVFTETPGITTTDGAQQIRRLCLERGLTYQVGSCLRYSPVYRKMKTLLDEWRRREPGPRQFNVRYYPYVGHFYNLLLFLNGDIGSVLLAQSSGGRSAATLLRFANGDLGSVIWQEFNNNTPPYEQVEVTHVTGRLVADDGQMLRFYRAPDSRRLAPWDMGFDQAEASLFRSTYSTPYGRNTQLYLRGYVPEFEAFAHCVRTGAAPVADVNAAEQTMQVSQAVARSGESGGQWTDVAAPGQPA